MKTLPGLFLDFLNKLNKNKGERIETNGLFYFFEKNIMMGRYNFASKYIYNKDVLDLACGEGLGSYYLSRTAKTVLGLDIDKEIIESNKKKYHSPNLIFDIMDIETFSIQKKFDVIISLETIEHLYDARDFLHKLHGLLKADGLLIISTPNRSFSEEFWGESLYKPFHIKEYTIDELSKLLRLAGFRNLKKYYYLKYAKRLKYATFLFFLLSEGCKVAAPSTKYKPASIIFVVSKN